MKERLKRFLKWVLIWAVLGMISMLLGYGMMVSI